MSNESRIRSIQHPKPNPKTIQQVLTFYSFSIEFAVQKSFVFIFLMLIACAHKAPPISKDRLNPRLIKATVLNARQLQLSFSEEIDTLALFADSMNIASDLDTVKVIYVYPSLSASEIVVATDAMKRVAYEITGTVFDKAENRGTFAANIQGTTVPDTIAPWVTGYAEGRNTREFFLNFSEAMDTTSLIISVVPKKKLIPSWVNCRYVRFIPEADNESLGHDTTYYLYLKTARDISGNHTQSIITAITRDSVYRPMKLKCNALLDEEPVAEGLAILMREIPIGVTMVKKGEFAFDVRDSLYFSVLVIAGEYNGAAQVKVGADNTINLQQGKVDIDRVID